MIAARLQWPQLTFAGKVDIDVAGSKVSITRVTEAGVDAMNASLPAVVSVVEKINEPRYPSFKGIMAAKKKLLKLATLQQLEHLHRAHGHKLLIQRFVHHGLQELKLLMKVMREMLSLTTWQKRS